MRYLKMNTVKKIFVFIFLLSIVLAITVGCSTTGSTTEKTVQKTKEDIAAEYIIEMIDSQDFYNPTQVRMQQVYYSTDSWDVEEEEADGVYHLKIQGTNKMGGTITQYHYIYLKGDETEYFYLDQDDGSILTGYFTSTDEGEKLDVGVINGIIKKHWEDLGLD